MKNRITLHLEDVPYRILRVMAAEENISMSNVVSKFLMGERSIVSDPDEIKKIEIEHDIEPDPEAEKTYKFEGKKMKKTSVKK